MNRTILSGFGDFFKSPVDFGSIHRGGRRGIRIVGHLLKDLKPGHSLICQLGNPAVFEAQRACNRMKID